MSKYIRRSLTTLTVVYLLTVVSVAYGDPASFDLTGPTLMVTVTRGVTMLPITQVPTLVIGDRLLLKAELPETQSEHYLMIAAFLRGPTNPPPEDWFYQCKTWRNPCIRDGLSITIPKGAQQLLVFFAPETGGDFKTLKSAVQGRPGAFVRAVQELNQAALDHARLDQYLAGVRQLYTTDPAQLKETAPILARSLAIKVDEKCLDRIPEQQASCLMQGQESLILNDGHSASMVATLTSGAASDLAMQAGSTAQLNSGAYLPYIGSIFDIARLMDSFHTAHYQYIPALTAPRDTRLTLMLNTPPSFHDPKSVLVVALPAIEPSQQPSLQVPDVQAAYCADKQPLVLLVQGAPLLFSTHYARDLSIAVTALDGTRIKLPVRVDAMRGGFVVDTLELSHTSIDEHTPASISGYWGFDKFSGPSFNLVDPRSQHWALSASDETALVVGRNGIIHLQSASASCIKDVRLKESDGQESMIVWKAAGANTLELTLPLQNTLPGALMLLVSQYGSAEPQSIMLNAFADASHVDSFTLYAGDISGILKGHRLDQVESMQLKDHEFMRGTLSHDESGDELPMTASDPQGVTNWKAAESGKAKVHLKDGRTFTLDVSIATSRPRGELIAKSVQLPLPGADHVVQLSDADEVPVDAKLVFSVRTRSPEKFAPDEQIEVATVDQSSSAILSVANGGMTLESKTVAVAALAPDKVFGSSTFGPLQFRLIARGVAGDWQRLATLVRLPVLMDLLCPAVVESNCQLTGTNLFLIDSVATDAQFTVTVRVQDGFPGFSLSVPHPTDGRLYIKLRDDPAVINVVDFASLKATTSTNDASTPSSAHATSEATPMTLTSQQEPHKNAE